MSGKFSKLQQKKSHGFKPYPYPNIFIPLANWTKFNAKKGGGGGVKLFTLNFSKWGEQ